MVRNTQQVRIWGSAGAVLLLFALLGAGPGTWTYDVEIHPELPKLSFTLLGDQGPGASIVAVEIRREGESEPFQTIDGLSVEPPSDGTRPTLEVIDMNFDGYGDFRIVEFLPAGPGVPFLNWLYDADRDAFVSSAALDDLPSPTFDAETRRVTSSWREGAATYGTDVYEWSAEELVVVRQEVKEYTAPGKYRLTVRQRIDGELEITEERDVEEDEEEESIDRRRGSRVGDAESPIGSFRASGKHNSAGSS